jgi:hypothetical protein
MAPEGVVNALTRIHRSLVPGGTLLDLHPTLPFATAEARGSSFGAFEEREFMAMVAETEAGVDEVVGRGLFALERELAFDVLERFDSAGELLETVSGWEGFHVSARLARRIRSAAPPVDVRERVVLSRFRAI